MQGGLCPPSWFPFWHFLGREEHQAEGNGLTLPVQDQAEKEKDKLLNYLN